MKLISWLFALNLLLAAPFGSAQKTTTIPLK